MISLKAKLEKKRSHLWNHHEIHLYIQILQVKSCEIETPNTNLQGGPYQLQ